MSVSLDTAVSSLTTNKRRVGALKSLGVVTVRDALTYYPFRVTDPVPARPIREARIGMPIAFAATVQALRVVPMNARRGFRLQAVVADDSGTAAQLVFFSYKKQYVDWVSMRLRQGARVVIAGVPSEFNGQLQFTHPEILTIAPVPAPQPGPGLPGTEPDPWQPDPWQPSPEPLPPVQPSSLKFDADSEEQALRRVCRPRPVYHATSRISSEHIHESIMGFLDALDDHAIPDILPESVRAAGGYLHRAEAFRAVHDPDTTDDFRRAIDTLRYEEAFVSQTALVRTRHSTHQIKAHNCAAGGPLVERFIGSLPFELTGGQRAVIDDVTADMQRDWPMQRLLQGEVGSGKTVVAVAAMLQAAGAGHQAVLVAPTQVLAEQHAETIGKMVAKIGAGAGPDSGGAEPAATTGEIPAGEIPVVLLTGGMKLAARRRALATIASGTPCIVVATHAAFSKTFQAPDLALVVIDEQHRFGVEQRETLRHRYDVAPHLLVMTATPIPRTAAMTWFGDLDLSWLTELPGGRKPIRTIVVPEADAGTMGRMFAHIRSRVDAGERAYIVCARIDADDDPAAEGGSGSAGGHGPGRGLEDRGYDAIDMFDEPDGDESTPKPPLHSVTEIADRLAALPQFRGLTLATLTGRDDDETKTRVMAEFADGTTPILVATTVIEVGVDVPQASCIVIFDADRFGLSQLHQLRGRVGRGGTNSWAFLISRAEPDSIAAQRLAVIQGTLDGAEIAQADLELRGAGDVLGDAQSGGKSSLKLLRVIKDAKLIERARADAKRVLEADPELAHEPQLAGAVLDFTRGNGEFLTST